MNVTALHPQTTQASLTARQLDTVRRTIAADCDQDEFNLYIEVIKRKQLDPFTRQCFPLVFSKGNKDKRRMTIIVSQDGLRALAARTADYRPDENEPVFEYDPTLKGPLNPIGIVKVTTTLWKMDTRGAWHPVKGWAYWDELAAVKEEWGDVDGRRQPTGRKSLDGNWPRMPRIMIAKCATMNGLRAGWPDTYGGLYAEEEMDKARVEMTASEIVEQEAQERRAKAVSMAADEYPAVDEQGNLHFVPAGRFADHFLALSHTFEAVAQLDAMLMRNREAFQRFWAKHKDDALQLRQMLDERRVSLTEADQ